MSDRNTERDDDELALTCKSCVHAWPVRLPRRVTLEQWTAVQEAQRCPACGVAYVVESRKPLPEGYFDR